MSDERISLRSDGSVEVRDDAGKIRLIVELKFNSDEVFISILNYGLPDGPRRDVYVPVSRSAFYAMVGYVSGSPSTIAEAVRVERERCLAAVDAEEDLPELTDSPTGRVDALLAAKAVRSAKAAIRARIVG